MGEKTVLLFAADPLKPDTFQVRENILRPSPVKIKFVTFLTCSYGVFFYMLEDMSREN